MNVNKIRSVCRVVRIVVGLGLIGVGILTFMGEEAQGNYLWFLGVVPLIAGIINFCPLCFITKKCDIPEVKEEGQ